MNHFPHQLVVANDLTEGDRPRIGFVFKDMVITNPFASTCGRFVVEPFEYGLSYEQAQQLRLFNDTITAATEKALETATDHINQLLLVNGLEAKPRFFRNAVAEREAIWSGLASYLVAAFNAARLKPAPSLNALDNSGRDQRGRIPATGIEFVRDVREALPAIQGWWNATPLPKGQICVHDPMGRTSELACLAVASKIDIRVFDHEGNPLFTSIVDGRAGLNTLFESLVGHRPDDDSYEPDAVKLLSSVSEMAYRHATGDAN